jgi:hypothetical protein
MTDQELFDVFLKCLREESAKMDPYYFQVPVFGADKDFLRERVYCYELYYLLRLGLGNHYPCKLMGELDKTSHPVIQPIAGPKEPDFLWHEPGEEKNIAIVEVKALARFPNGSIIEPRIIDDTKKLLTFLHPDIHYRKAIQLLYGPGDIKELETIAKKVSAAAGHLADRIIVVWHPGPNSKAHVVPSS